MHAIPFEKMIPSPDVRSHCEKVGRVFTLSEQATLVWRNGFLTLAEKDALLKTLSERCGGTPEEQKLKKEIEEQLAFDKKIERVFYEAEAEAFYSIRWHYKNAESEEDDFYFSSFERCKRYVEAERAHKEKFGDEVSSLYVQKNYLDVAADENLEGGFRQKHIGAAFTKDFVLRNIFSTGFGGESFTESAPRVNNRFEDSYVEVPHPFRKGDIVKSLGADMIYARGWSAEGIVVAPKDDDDYKSWAETIEMRKERGLVDCSDICLRVEYLCGEEGDYNFSHGHPYIPAVVYAEPAYDTEEERARGHLFEIASELLRGDGSLEMFAWSLSDYNKESLLWRKANAAKR